MDKPLLLSVDFDGVIHDPNNRETGYKLGKPINNAAQSMQTYKNEGAIITINSVWANTDQKCHAISEWCRYFGIPYDFITNKKPIADFYIDDNALRFESWDQTMKDISRLRN
jgi:hypothetical protein